MSGAKGMQGALPQSRQIRRQRSAQCSVPKACSALDDRAGNEEPAHKNALQGQPAGRGDVKGRRLVAASCSIMKF